MDLHFVFFHKNISFCGLYFSIPFHLVKYDKVVLVPMKNAGKYRFLH
nr:MAG TPA: hypothetical protein [Caudoviricetes sp.]